MAPPLINDVTGPNLIAITGTAHGSNTVGVKGKGDASGVQGFGAAWNGVEGISQSTIGGVGVFGANDTGVGVKGISKATYNPAVYGVHQGEGGAGVQGQAEHFVGVIGVSKTWVGVYGESAEATGQYPSFPVGVWGNAKGGIGVFGTGAIAGKFLGNVYIENGSLVCGTGGGYAAQLKGGLSTTWDVDCGGRLTVYGEGDFYRNVRVRGRIQQGLAGFMIDHPVNPAQKYLCHSVIESSDMKNLYDGTAVLNAKGVAVVKLPSWFQALNHDFRYQLTPVGAPAPNLHVAQEIRHKRFKIAGGKPGMKVSWQVTGVRCDAFAKANPMPVEEAKAKGERGRYLHPEAHGQPRKKGIVASPPPAAKERLKKSETPMNGKPRNGKPKNGKPRKGKWTFKPLALKPQVAR